MGDDLSGGRRAPPRDWNRSHGNGKSTSGGLFHVETVEDGTGRYGAEIGGTNDDSGVVIDDGNPAKGPSFAHIISVLRGNYG